MFPKRLKRQKQNTSSSRSQTLYQPSIYTYTCRGVYHVSSEAHHHKEGSCRGFRSRLELLSDMEMNSRKGALEDFTYWAAGGDMDNGYDLETEDGGEALDPQTKSVLVSPALIYKEEAESPKKKDSGVIEKENSSEEEVNTDVSSMLPEEELIQRQDWKCYGSTQVDYLLLTNPKTGKEQIAAVAPRNNGLAIRKIQADPGNNVTCIGLGWLSIVMDSVSLEDENVNSSRNATREKQEDLSTSTPTITPEEVPPKPNMDTLAAAKASAKRVFHFSQKVGEHMKLNAAWMYHTLQDDFSARTVASGKRLLHQLPVTIDRTAGFMRKIASKFTDVFDDDDDDSDNGRGR